MKNKVLKISLMALLTIIFMSMTMVPVFALDDPSRITAQPSSAATRMQEIGGMILGVVQVVGASVAVIMLIVLAIKYISAAPNDKAEIKKHAVIYVVGAVVLFGAAGILGIIRNFAKDSFPEDFAKDSSPEDDGAYYDQNGKKYTLTDRKDGNGNPIYSDGDGVKYIIISGKDPIEYIEE